MRADSICRSQPKIKEEKSPCVGAFSSFAMQMLYLFAKNQITLTFGYNVKCQELRNSPRKRTTENTENTESFRVLDWLMLGNWVDWLGCVQRGMRRLMRCGTEATRKEANCSLPQGSGPIRRCISHGPQRYYLRRRDPELRS